MRHALEDLDNMQQQETKLKDEWRTKKAQAVNLEEYQKQLAESNRSFGALLKQLPNASEMESLLIDINQAALQRGELPERASSTFILLRPIRCLSTMACGL